MDYIGNPPRPRKPKKSEIFFKDVCENINKQILEKARKEIPSDTVPFVLGMTGPLEIWPTNSDDVDYVYEFGKAEPVATIINNLESDKRFLQLEAEQKHYEEYMKSLKSLLISGESTQPKTHTSKP
jgi:hypothetical protein